MTMGGKQIFKEAEKQGEKYQFKCYLPPKEAENK